MSRGVKSSGFALIELLVAIAVIGTVLAAVGGVVATTMRGSRVVQDRLAASSIAETLLAGLSDRASVRPGRSSGEISGYRWTMDISPMNSSDAEDRWQPCGVNIEVHAGRGPLYRLASLILLPRASS